MAGHSIELMTCALFEQSAAERGQGGYHPHPEPTPPSFFWRLPYPSDERSCFWNGLEAATKPEPLPSKTWWSSNSGLSSLYSQRHTNPQIFRVDVLRMWSEAKFRLVLVSMLQNLAQINSANKEFHKKVLVFTHFIFSSVPNFFPPDSTADFVRNSMKQILGPWQRLLELLDTTIDVAKLPKTSCHHISRLRSS